MKKLLFMVLVPFWVLAQTPNRPVALNLAGYIGNPIEATINLAPSDTAKTITAKALDSDSPYAALVSPQPVLSRTGLKLAIQFPPSNLVRAFLEIRVGGLIRYSGWLSADKAPAPSNPASLTALQYITLKGDTGPAGPKGDTGPKGDPGTPLVQSVAGRQGAVQIMFADLVAHPNTAAGYGINDVYTKTQTYSQAETDAKKPDFEIVGTFSEAQTKSVSGKPKVFILTNDTPYGGSSVVIWSGSSFTVLPGIPRTRN